jgi:hypothetical protein
MIAAIVSAVARRSIEGSIFRIRSNGTFTVWSPSAYTDGIDVTHGRVTSDRTVEVACEDLGY